MAALQRNSFCMHEPAGTHIQRLLRLCTPAAGGCSTPVPGLTLWRGQEGAKQLFAGNALALALVIQGAAFVISDGTCRRYHEHDCFLVTPQPAACSGTSACSGSLFLAFSLRISRHVLCLLDAGKGCTPPRQGSKGHARSGAASINRDLIRCFHRLIGLIDKPEQIAVRAPIIICEIHYLILISRAWARIRQLSPGGSC